MLDESTSAIDTATESILYQLMIDLHIWFVTISHRPSLIRYHTKELKLYLPHSTHRDHDLNLNNDQEVSLDLTTDPETTSTQTDETMIDERPLTNSRINMDTAGYVEVKKSSKWLKEVRDVWKLIHIPFGNNERTLRVQVNTHLFIATLLIGCLLMSDFASVMTEEIFFAPSHLFFLLDGLLIRVYHVLAFSVRIIDRDYSSPSWDWLIDWQ